MQHNVLMRVLAAIAAAVATLALVAACSATAPIGAGKLALADEPLLGKFVWHDLITDDVASSRRFYGGLLGWQFEQTTHPQGGEYTLILADGHYLGGIIFLADPDGSDYSRWLPYLSVADVDAAVRATQSAGGAALVGPLDLGNMGRAAAVSDPQGAVLGLLRSRAGDPDDTLASAPGRVVWNELLAADDLAAAGFYAALAGLEVSSMPRPGGRYTTLRAQGRERAGIMLRPDERLKPLWLTHFAVADVEAAAGRAAELGGKVLLAPSPQVRDSQLAVVTDPSGAILALQQR
jgi:predicted enzyme related to lactoylglutathione lyase